MYLRFSIDSHIYFLLYSLMLKGGGLPHVYRKMLMLHKQHTPGLVTLKKTYQLAPLASLVAPIQGETTQRNLAHYLEHI